MNLVGHDCQWKGRNNSLGPDDKFSRKGEMGQSSVFQKLKRIEDSIFQEIARIK